MFSEIENSKRNFPRIVELDTMIVLNRNKIYKVSDVDDSSFRVVDTSISNNIRDPTETEFEEGYIFDRENFGRKGRFWRDFFGDIKENQYVVFTDNSFTYMFTYRISFVGKYTFEMNMVTETETS